MISPKKLTDVKRCMAERGLSPENLYYDDILSTVLYRMAACLRRDPEHKFPLSFIRLLVRTSLYDLYKKKSNFVCDHVDSMDAFAVPTTLDTRVDAVMMYEAMTKRGQELVDRRLEVGPGGKWAGTADVRHGLDRRDFAQQQKLLTKKFGVIDE